MKRHYTPEQNKWSVEIDVYPVDAALLSSLLSYTHEEAQALYANRRASIKRHLPNLLGEYALRQNLMGEPKSARATAITRHAIQLGLGPLVYVGCDGSSYVHEGRIFGSFSSAQQREHQSSNETYGVHAYGWSRAVFGNIEPLRYAGDPEKAKIGMVLGLDSAKLEPTAKTSAGWQQQDVLHWKIVHGESIESAVRVIYVATTPNVFSPGLPQ